MTSDSTTLGPCLLDVNVLIALFDPEHIQHETAHRWFAEERDGDWASCPLTENGLVRVVSNPAYPGSRCSVSEATVLLRRFREREDHAFWGDSVSILDERHVSVKSLQGYRQITDVYLLALAVANKGRLATFDTSIPMAAVPGAREKSLLVLS